jgi:hypothetical protein
VYAKVRREHHILGEIVRRVPQLEKMAYHWQWDCPIPGGCTLKRPDMLFALPKFYLQVEVDEEGHEGFACVDEDARLELIAADLGLPGIVIRVNPDAAPMLKRRKLANGEAAWAKTETFDEIMDEIQEFLTRTLRREDVRDVERYSVAALGDLA